MNDDQNLPSLEEEPTFSESEYAWMFDHETNAREALEEKLRDLATPGLIVEFSPEEADLLGAFDEDALSDEEAFRGVVDLPGGLRRLAELTAREV